MAKLAVAVVALWFLVLGVAVPTQVSSLDANFEERGCPKVRIFCKRNPNFHVAVRGGAVVLAPANCSDETQLWYQDYSSTGKLAANDGCRKPFTLVNVATGQAMLSPTDGSRPVKLAPYDYNNCVPLSTLWTQGAVRDDGYYQVKVLRDEYQALNGLGGGVRDGTVVGIYPSQPVSDNAIWKITACY
ncbi:hypothetical protein ACP70R_011998 [Stipagrostis hirtigluma subsp. patula]